MRLQLLFIVAVMALFAALGTMTAHAEPGDGTDAVRPSDRPSDVAVSDVCANITDVAADLCRDEGRFCQAHPELCRRIVEYCHQHPDACRTFIEFCHTYPELCREFAQFCIASPERCVKIVEFCRTHQQFCERLVEYCQSYDVLCRVLLQSCSEHPVRCRHFIECFLHPDACHHRRPVSDSSTDVRPTDAQPVRPAPVTG
jgi:hypothetical protein